VTSTLPSSVLFCCDHNAVRSPMAEGLMKQRYGQVTYVQSAGVYNDLEIDGFSFDEMQEWGDDLSGFDLIVALSPASQRRALELTRFYHLDVEYWPILDPTGLGTKRDEKLDAYRQTRDQILGHMDQRFGPPSLSDT